MTQFWNNSNQASKKTIESMSDYWQNCPEVYIGGKKDCHGSNCNGWK